MPDLMLMRVGPNAKRTDGVLVRMDWTAIMVTLEREYDGGSNRASTDTEPGACIPAGRYLCKRYNSPKFGWTFEVTGVAGRKFILFHWGNIEADSHGCILVGNEFDPVKGQDGILGSKDAFEEFMAYQHGVDEFWLTVIDAFKMGAS